MRSGKRRWRKMVILPLAVMLILAVAMVVHMGQAPNPVYLLQDRGDNNSSSNWEARDEGAPAEPVAELGETPTIMLMSMGLVGLAGYLWLKRRKA